MSKKDYQISKNVDLVSKRGYSNFLSVVVAPIVKYYVKKSKIYTSFEDCEKLIVYLKKPPQLTTFEIVSFEKITHREIMGSIYNLSIDPELFGDIVYHDGKFYIIILKKIEDVVKREFNTVGGKSIKLKKEDNSILNNYKRKYEPCKLIVSSLRVDTIVSKIVGISRKKIKNYFKDESVIVNCIPIFKCDKVLNINDIFSIRGYGKYKFDKIIKKTKKGGYIIGIKKYI